MKEKAKQLGSQPVFPADANPHLDYLTKREYFIGLAFQGMLANSVPGHHRMPGNLIPEAVMYADALLEELSKEKGDNP